VCHYEPTFEGGYTDTVEAGDGDFISKDTFWDFKVSKSHPTSKHTLQILMYYVMGLHSVHDHFKTISNLGFFNPRLNIAYICPVSKIPAETIMKIENDVLCYGKSIIEKAEPVLSLPEDYVQPMEFTVANICEMTNLNKNMIYADIRSGKLVAYKKNNRYYVSEFDLQEYIKKKELQRKIQIGILIVTALIPILAALVIMLCR